MAEYDPGRALWLPSRRKFFFLGLAAGVAPFLPDVPRWPEIYSLAMHGNIQPTGQIFLGPGLAKIESVYLNGKILNPALYSVQGNMVTFHPQA